MNVTLIPFFLAANVVVNDVSEWKYGPEYLFNFNMTGTVTQDTPESAYTGYCNTTIRCRPKDSDILFCHMGNITTLVSYENHTHDQPFEKKFAILFNETGVQALMIEPPLNDITANITRMIANQFSMDANEIRNNDVQQPISQYIREESTLLGNCMTTYVIKRKELEANEIKKDSNFQLKVIPMPEVTIPETRMSISKIRRNCTTVLDMTGLFEEGVFEMERFSSVLLINDGFQTFTIINGYVKSEDSSSNGILLEVTIALDLDSIKPADHEFPSDFSGEIFDLNLESGVFQKNALR